MSKALKPGDVEKLQKRLCQVSSLGHSIHMLQDGAHVLVSLGDTMGRHERFYINDMSSKGDLANIIKRLLKSEKDAIRKKYDIDIK